MGNKSYSACNEGRICTLLSVGRHHCHSCTERSQAQYKRPEERGLRPVQDGDRQAETAVGSRRATPTPTMGVAPVSTLRPLGEPSPQAARPTRPTPTTTLGPPRPNISKRRLLISKEKKKKKKTTKFKIVPHFH